MTMAEAKLYLGIDLGGTFVKVESLMIPDTSAANTVSR